TECPASCCIFNETPPRRLFRKDILNALDALDRVHIQRPIRKNRDYSGGLPASQRRYKAVVRQPGSVVRNAETSEGFRPTNHARRRMVAPLRRSARGVIVRALFNVWENFMSVDQPTRRVIALAPMPPEKSAYALARYSRSPDTIESSLRWVHGHSAEKFWDQFYFDYGHASIADL